MDILVSQIDSLTESLDRIYNLLRSTRIAKEYCDPIRGKFARAINNRKKDLDDLKCDLAARKVGSQEGWKMYGIIRMEGQKIFDQCLDFLGGIAVRTMELEDGFCDLAEHLVRHYADETGVTWSSVMILGDERPFDDLARLTQIIRLQFPEWDVWSLPFIAYEFGQLVAREDTLLHLMKFFVSEEERIKKLMSEKQAEKEQIAPVFIECQTKYQAGELSEEALERFFEQQRAHIRSLFADAFATYFLGPAYLYSRLNLRLVASKVFEERPHKPSLGVRAFFMLETLEKMNEASKVDKDGSGSYDGELKRFRAAWLEIVKNLNPEYEVREIGEPYRQWFEKMYAQLEREYSAQGFKADVWEKAKDLGKRFLEDTFRIPPETTLPVVLNAAWICRRQMPSERLAEIARQTRKFCSQVIGARAAPSGSSALGAPRRV